MARPQQNELYRSGTTPALAPDSIGSELEARRDPKLRGLPGSKVPAENQPGHHPAHEQDKPDLERIRADQDSRWTPGRRRAIIGLGAALIGIAAVGAAAYALRRRRRSDSRVKALLRGGAEDARRLGGEAVDLASRPLRSAADPRWSRQLARLRR